MARQLIDKILFFFYHDRILLHTIIYNTLYTDVLYYKIVNIYSLDMFIFIPLWEVIINLIEQIFDNKIIFNLKESYKYMATIQKNINNNIKQTVVFISSNVITEHQCFLAKNAAYFISR